MVVQQQMHKKPPGEGDRFPKKETKQGKLKPYQDSSFEEHMYCVKVMDIPVVRYSSRS